MTAANAYTNNPYEPSAKSTLPILDIFSAGVRRKILVAFIVGASLLLALTYLHFATPVYEVVFKVTPVDNSQDQTGNRLGGLASLAGIALQRGGNTMAFDIYLEQLTGRTAADALAAREDFVKRMFAGEWDAANQRWREPRSVALTVTRSIKQFIGMTVRPWHPPDGERIQERLESLISISRPLRTPIVTVSIRTSDPAWGQYFVWALHQSVDNSLRQKTLEREGRYIEYLKNELARIQVGEYREALAATLAEQEKRRMVASAGLPYAAEPLEPPTASSQPVSPNARSVILLAVVLGAAFAFALAWFIERWQARASARGSSRYVEK